jgi:hypothetical protein
MNITTTEKQYHSQLRILFQSNEQAIIVLKCMQVDDELQPHRLEKTLSVEDNYLIV